MAKAARKTKPRTKAPQKTRAQVMREITTNIPEFMLDDGMTLKQRAFADKYVETGNASEAYRYAYDAEGMLEATVNRRAFELLHHGKIRARISVLSAVHEITPQRVMAEVSAMGFANVADYFEWGTDKVAVRDRKTREVVRDPDTNEIVYEWVPWVRFKDSKDLTRKQMAAIAGIEVTTDKSGRRVMNVKLADKNGPLAKMMQKLGLTKDAGDNFNISLTRDAADEFDRKLFEFLERSKEAGIPAQPH